MEEVNRFYRVIEIMFFIWWFWLFLVAMFLKNAFYPELSKQIILSLDMPFLVVALTYWLLSIRLKVIEEKGWEWSSDVIDWILVLIWICIFSLILYSQLAFPDII